MYTINKKEVLRYLGHKNQEIDNDINYMIDEVMDEIKLLINERYIYKFYKINRESFLLENSNFELLGIDIKKHLQNSEECVLVAATLGHKVDTQIRYYEKISMTRALILDACASVAIEEVCDRICEEININLDKDNKSLTERYSPGYGDLPIDIQNDFLNVLNAKNTIGLTATSSGILIPRKSVTAIVGIISGKSIKADNKCLNCNNKYTCMYRNEGSDCGH